MAKRSKPKFDGFVLRSGYLVPLDSTDAPAMVDHLQSAILGDSLQKIARQRRKSWQQVAKEIEAEVEHLADSMPVEFARALMIALLTQSVIDRLRETAKDVGFPALLTKTIQ